MSDDDALQHNFRNRRGTAPAAAGGKAASDMSGLPSLASAFATAFLLRFAGLPSSPSAFLLHASMPDPRYIWLSLAMILARTVLCPVWHCLQACAVHAALPAALRLGVWGRCLLLRTKIRNSLHYPFQEVQHILAGDSSLPAKACSNQPFAVLRGSHKLTGKGRN